MGLTQVFSDIADAIREKSGSSDTYLPEDMAQAIEDIPSGGGGSVSISANRIIEDIWDGVGSTTYTFTENISDCIIALNFVRETAMLLSNTTYTLTLASGSYEVLEDTGIVVGTASYSRTVYLRAKNIKANDTLYMYCYGDQRNADLCRIN